jgi:putative ABC transport system permease protein
MKGADVLVHQKAFAWFAAEAQLALNLPVLLFALGTAVVTTLVSGLIPALRAMPLNLQPQLAGGKSGGNSFRHTKLRSGLVIGQVALSILLLSGAGLVIRSFVMVKGVDLGFDPKNVLLVYFELPQNFRAGRDLKAVFSPSQTQLRNEVVERLKRVPGITSVSVQDSVPGYNSGYPARMSVPGEKRTEEAGLVGSDESLFQTLDFRQMLQGRWLTREDVQGVQNVAVITAQLATDLFGSNNPVGQQVEVSSEDTAHPPLQALFQVVGVVNNMKNDTPLQAPRPMAFIPNTIRGSFMILVRTAAPPARMVRAVEEQIWAVDRNEIVELCNPLEDAFQQWTYAMPELYASISAPLASIGLLLVLVGIFSLMAYTVSLRTQEIGIRMALGARPTNILWSVLGKGLSLVAVGAGVGLAVSFALTRFLASQIWGVSPTDPWTFAAVIGIIAAVGLLACWLPARRAMRVDPMVALRYE